MTDKASSCIAILAGGQSRRMGQDKALLEFQGKRLVDHAIDRFHGHAGALILSAAHDFGTGLQYVPDDQAMPNGPVGAIFSLCRYFSENDPTIAGFVTVPVDAPFAPLDLVDRLTMNMSCSVAADGERVHPTFAYWRCDMVNTVQQSLDSCSKSPSLRWLASQCDAKTVEWSNAKAFTNINAPGDLIKANNPK